MVYLSSNFIFLKPYLEIFRILHLKTCILASCTVVYIMNLSFS